MLAGLKPTFASVSPCVMVGGQTSWAFWRGRRTVAGEQGQTPRGHLSSAPRGGCALPAGASAIAVTVGSAMAAVPQGSSFTWPSFTVITTSRSIWRGKSHKSKRGRQVVVASFQAGS